MFYLLQLVSLYMRDELNLFKSKNYSFNVSHSLEHQNGIR